MQSDKYGDIADLTRAVRVVTPAGVLATRPVPHASTGPSVREMVLGSEGRLGIISEATVHVHRVPEQRVILGYLFPDWPSALAAMHDIAASEASPSVTRVSDANETQFSFATRKDPSPIDRVKSKALTTYLERRRNFDLEAMCLSFIGYEGTKDHVAAQRKLVGRIVKRHGGLSIGASPGELYDQKKFDTPYIRDYLLDRGALADVSETAAPWSGLPTVYGNVMANAQAAFDDLRVHGYIMCHLSHSYHSGACLYFTFGFKPSGAREPLEEYDVDQVGHPADVRRLGRHALTPPRGRHRARVVARTGHLGARSGDAPRALRRHGPGRQPQPGEDRLRRLVTKRSSGLPVADRARSRVRREDVATAPPLKTMVLIGSMVSGAMKIRSPAPRTTGWMTRRYSSIKPVSTSDRANRTPP